jgi:iron complex transport system substrate-binding protein
MKCLPLLFSFLLLFSVFAGCSAPGEPSGPEPRAFTDDTGVEFEIPDRVERIVSLAPSETELCCAAGGCDLLVGRTDYCNHPAGVEQVETVGGPRSFSVEKVIGLSPDLVLATTVSDSIRIQELRSAGLTVVVFKLETVDDIYRNIESIGILLSSPEVPEELVRSLKARQEEIEQRSHDGEEVKVLYILWDEPLRVAGNNTFQNDLITRAGGINIMEDTEGYATVSEETVVNRAPDIIIVSREHTAGLARITDRLLSKPSLAEVPAVKNEQIFEMEADLVNRPGPRVIEALEKFSQCINA